MSLRRGAAVTAEAARVTWSQPVPALLVLGVAAAVCAATLVTAGQTVAAQRTALRALGDVQARTIEIRSTGTPSIEPAVLAQVAGLSEVELAAGLGQAFAVHVPGVATAQAPAIAVHGDLPGIPEADGRPLGYVTVASARRVGLETAAGSVVASAGTVYPVAGWFRSPAPLGQLEDFVVVRGTVPTAFERVVVLARSVAAVDRVADALDTLHLAQDPATVTVQRPDVLLEARRTLQGEFSSYGRSMVLAFEGTGTLCIMLLVFAGTLARRRDFGRRRALGAGRGALVWLVVVQTMLPALAGAVLGTVAGMAALTRLAGASPGWRYPLAVATLTLLSTAVAAFGPSLLAAWRDPVTVLRTP